MNRNSYVVRVAIPAIVVLALAISLYGLLGRGSAPLEVGEISLARDTGQTAPEEVQEVQPVVEEEGAVLPQSQPSSAQGCQAKQWQLTPTGFSLGPQRDGWKVVLVDLVAINGSQVWGSVWLNGAQGGTTLTAEDGSVYEPLKGFVGPSGGYPSPEFPWELPEPYTSVVVDEAGAVVSKMMPPGFAMRGVLEPPYPPIPQFHLAFLVADDAERFTLTITGTQVICYRDDGEQTGESLPPLELTLGEGYPRVDYPTTEELLSLTEPVVVPSLGTLRFLDIDYSAHPQGGDEVVVSFNLSNPNRGQEAWGAFSAYIIGDDGIAYPGYGRFQIGPGYSGDGDLRFRVASELGHPTLVLMELAPATVMIGAYALP